MTSYLKTMLAGLRHWVTAQKADWSQNDETAASYIKGRPCYEDDSGKPVPLPAKYLPTIPAEKLPTIPAKKLPTIPAEKLPEIPAEKLPGIPAEKLPSSILTVEQKTFEGSFDKVTDGRDTFVYNAFNYYKISEFSPRREDVISFSGTRENGEVFSNITEGKNCCRYGFFFIVVYQAGQCRLTAGSTIQSFNAPSAGLYASYDSGNAFITAGTYNFTLRLVRNIIQSSTTFKRYYLDVDETGALTTETVTE